MLIKRVLWPDTHYPFQDEKSVSLAIDVVRDFKPHEIIILGDWWDLYTISKFDKDPRKTFSQLEEEIIHGREALYKLYQICRRVIFIMGNHEARLQKFINAYAAILSVSIEINKIFGFPKGMHVIPYGKDNVYKMPGLVATHGSICGQNPAAQMVKKYGCSVAFGHVHRIQEYHISNVHGEDFVGFTMGWLGDEAKAAEYLNAHSDWSQGIAVTVHKGDKFFHQIVPIKGHELVFGGKIYPGPKNPTGFIW